MSAAEGKKGKWIEIEENGPYIVHGNIPLVRKTQVVSEYGEPLTWMKTERIPTSGDYKLCRCGQTTTPPFCDMTHMEEDFDGTETASTDTYAERHVVIEDGTQIVVKRDSSLCMESGFCGTRLDKLEQMAARTGDINVRSQVIAMIERCPSGSFTYAIRSGQPDIEPDLPRQIAMTTEITSEGPIPGPIWVTGNIPIERSDGRPFETRNRVTLCCCGLSKIKPLCDGAHRESETEKLRKKMNGKQPGKRGPNMSADLHTCPLPASFFEPRRDTAYTWLGMAGVAINARGTIVLIDPLLSATEQDGKLVSEVGEHLKVALPIEAGQVPRVDWVLYTHADFDHVGQQTARSLASRLDCRFLAPAPVVRILKEMGVQAERIQTARDFMRLQVGETEIEVSPALHDWQSENPWQREDCCGYLLHTPDGTIWHPGDTRLIPELLDVRGVDVFFFDVAAVEAHLGPSGSATLAASCGASTLIAYHYGTFDLPPGSYGGCDPQDALVYLKDLKAHFLCPGPGEIFRLPG